MSSTGAPSSGGQSGGLASPKPKPDEINVYWLDISFLCVLAVFFLASLPRAIVRLCSFSEIKRGLILKASLSMPLPGFPRASHVHTHSNDGTMTTTDVHSDQSHTLADHNRSCADKEWAVGRGGSLSPPPHVPSMSTILYPLSSFFSYSITPSKTVGKIMLCLTYLCGILFVILFSSNPLTDPACLGFIAVSQIPVIIALGTKNNIIGMLSGMGYERLNYIHRWVGIVILVTANFHALGYLYKYAIAGKSNTELQKPFVRWGVLALVGIELLGLLSLGLFRRRAYSMFLAAHGLGFFLLMIGVCYHEKAAVNYVVLGAIAYGFDHLLRLLKTRICTARLEAIPELSMTRIEVPSLNRGWRAGQHVRLRVLSTELGWAGWSIAHPFTIANASGHSSGGLVLMCKKAGGWTNRLYAAAERAGYYEAEDCVGPHRSMRIIVEGPYGGLGNMILSSYSSVLIIAGGSGATFALSEAEELTEMLRKGRSRVKFIELVWITQVMSSLNPLIPTFSSIIDGCGRVPGVVLKISVFYSRATPTPTTLHEYTTTSSIPFASLSPTLELQPGRPKLSKILDSLMRCTSALRKPSGVAVCVCGPIELAEEVRKLTREVNGPSRFTVGGVEIHEEVFGW